MAAAHGDRYVPHDRFIDLCRELGIGVDGKTLEYFERKKLLFPVRRVLLDPEYVKYVGRFAMTEGTLILGRTNLNYQKSGWSSTISSLTSKTGRAFGPTGKSSILLTKQIET